MLAPRLSPPSTSLAPSAAAAYFDHRAATSRTPVMLLGADLDVLWTNAAALGLSSRRSQIALVDDRLILSPRRHEDSLRAFLAETCVDPGVWVLEADEAWLVRVDPISPADAAPAWMLTWQLMDGEDRYLWADLGAHLSLTPSETRILRSLLDGSSVDETAVQLSISIQTARTHVRRIYAKLDVSNREQLFAVALPYRWG